MTFDLIELITFGIASIAFIFIFRAYLSNLKKRQNKLLTSFLVISILLLLNRFFTNIEALFYKDLFNLLEHLSVLFTSVVFLHAVWRYREGKN